MRKLVNGKVVDINNIELFELAAEGLALQNNTVSVTYDGIDGKIEQSLLQRYIKGYDIFYKSMPYPLYAIEADIKYATLGNFIKAITKDNIKVWVDKGLFIRIDENTGMALHIVNNTWGINYVKEDIDDNTSMELYKDSVGYNEYKWVLDKIISKKSTANYYAELMPEFVKACNSQPMILKWELENILTFGALPEKIETKQNKIIDIAENKEYTLDIYLKELVESSKKVQAWNLTGGGSYGSRTKYIKVYEYDLYVKNIVSDNTTTKDDGKISKTNVVGIRNVFNELCAVKEAFDKSTFSNFEGYMADNIIAYTIDKKLFVSKSNRMMEPKEIAHGVELYSISRNTIYFIKTTKVNEKINKETVYSYNSIDGNIRLCKILFVY